MEKSTDSEIINFLQSGNSGKQEQAFRLLYRNYFGLIENLVVSNSGTKEDAADVFHDGLIVLFNSIKKGTFQIKSTVKTYLYSICRNLWLMKLRKNKREISLEDKHTTIAIQEDHFKTLEVDEKKGLLKKLLLELNEDCQKILDLFYFRKLKMEEIRQQLNLANEQVAKNKKSRCMKSIRMKIKENALYAQSLKDQ